MHVVKIGGSLARDPANALDELSQRDDVALVHGFGPQADASCRARGIEQRTLRSPSGVTSRFTDEAVLEALREAAETVQARLVEALEARGADPEPLGLDVPLFWGEAKPALPHRREDGRTVLVRGNRSGRVADVQPHPVEDAIGRGRTPVVTPIGLDGEGPLSVDADRGAAALAGALDADALALLTDVPGLLEDPTDPTSRLETVPREQVDALVGDTARGGMARKLVAAREALEAGVDRALVADGRRPAPLRRALAGQATEVLA